LKKNVEKKKTILPAEFNKKMTIREAVALAIEAARAGQVNGAQSVVTNMRKKFGDDLIPSSMDVKEPFLPLDAIPFHLSYAEGMDGAGAAIPTEMDLDASDEIIMENFGTLQQWGQEWLRYMGENASSILEDFQKKGSLVQAHLFDLSKIKDPTQAVVCGSGASLNEMSKFLPDFPGIVVCGASNASNVAASGRVPDLILAIDAGVGTILHLSGVPYDSLGSTLITPTASNPEVPCLFPNNRLWFTSIIQMAKGANHPFNVFSHMLFPFIQSFMFQAGCTINAELLFLNLLSEYKKISLDAVYLLGCDFAYKKGASRCLAYKRNDDLTYEQRDISHSTTEIQTRSQIWRSANGLLTDDTMLGYKRSLLTVWLISKLPIYDCSDGIITEVPKVEFIRLAKDGFRGRPPSYEHGTIIEAYNRYLTSIGYIPGKAPGFEGQKVEGELWT